MKVRPLDENTFEDIVKFQEDGLHVKSREGQSLEFKESFNGNAFAKYLKTMAAFANHAGGYIVFGITDSPRTAVGLKKKSLDKFEQLKIESFDTTVGNTFLPHIEWDCRTYDYRGMKFGIIYVSQSASRPVICSSQNGTGDDILREGDIFYRYTGQSKRIGYPELERIIQEERLNEQQRWSSLMAKIAKIGASDAALLDISTGVLSGAGGTVVIDEDIMSRITFIKEGEFSEVKGKPTLKLIGEVKSIESGRLVLGEKRVSKPKAIDSDYLIKSFLKKSTVEDPFEYLRAIASGNTANMPLYYYLHKGNITIDDATSFVARLSTRGKTKERLLKRLQGKRIDYSKPTGSDAYRKKFGYAQQWLSGDLAPTVNEFTYKVQAVKTLSSKEISSEFEIITQQMLSMYEIALENKLSSSALSAIREAICYIDEQVYLSDVECPSTIE